MSDIYDRTRMLVALLEGEKWPVVIGAMPEATSEIISHEDWDKWKAEMAEKWLGPDWPHYEYIEVLVTIPSADLFAMFEAREISPTAVERDA